MFDYYLIHLPTLCIVLVVRGLLPQLLLFVTLQVELARIRQTPLAKNHVITRS